jgi:glycosyltransferase involved in cell wall biosynthesis
VHRIAIVASHVIQYQDPFFRRLAADPELDVTVLYCSREGADVYRDVDMGTSLRWDLDLLRGYRYTFLRRVGPFNPGLVPAIAFGRYDAVLFMLGWGPPTAWLGFAAAIATRTPLLMFGDSSFVPDERGVRAALRRGVLRALFRLTSAFLISGKRNAGYYEHYGADRRSFFPLPWAIDNERFADASRLAPGERDALRDRYGIRRDAVVFLDSGKLIARKDPLALVRAFAAMRHRDRAALVFLGDGVLRPELESFIRAHDLRDVHLPGFVNQTEIPKLYAMSDALVLPSHFDPRATVINEAMACGLPVVITDRCGPFADIAQHGDNAFVFAPGDVDALRDALDTLASDDALRRRTGERSRAIIATWSYAEGVAGVKEALQWLKR